MGLFIFWLMLQLVLMMALLVGGIYVLYCLGRAAAGLDRLASAAEEWVQQQKAAAPANTEAIQPPGSLLRNQPYDPAPPTPPSAPLAPPPSTAEGSSTIRPSY
jgi:hypothetical protein